MKKQNKKGGSIFDDRRVTVVFALILAVLSWIIIAGFINPGEETTIDKVPINYVGGEGAYKNQGLALVTEGPANARVKVSGNGSTIYSLTAGDISVYIDYSIVNGPGEYELNLKGDAVVGSFAVESILPRTVRLRFEKINKQNFEIGLKADGVEAQEGYFRDSLRASADKVEVSGPASSLDKVTQAVAIVNATEVLDETKIYSNVQIQLLDGNGDPVEDELFVLSPAEVEVTVPILEVRSVPIVVGFAGVSSSFDTEWLSERITLSETEIRVAGEPEALNSLPKYNIGSIDLSMLEKGKEFEPFVISLPQGIKNYDKLQEVKVGFDASGLAEKTFVVPTIEVLNQPVGVSVKPIETQLANVRLMGPEDVIEGLLPENIIAQVEASGVSVKSGGQQNLSVRIIIPSSNQVFAVGTYTMVCDITPDTEGS